MLEKVKALGLEKFAGDEAMAEQFVAAFVAHVMLEKEAADKEAMQKEAAERPQDLGRTLMEGAAKSLGESAAGLVANTAVAGLMAGSRLVTDQFRYQRFLRALEHAIASNRVLRDTPKAKVQRYADTVYNFAPLVAVDPNLLGSVLANAVLGDGIDLMTIKSLTDLESRHRDNGSLNPKALV